MLTRRGNTGFFHAAHRVDDQFCVGVKDRMPSAAAVTKLYTAAAAVGVFLLTNNKTTT